MKKIASVFFALILCCSLGAPVFAAEADTGSVEAELVIPEGEARYFELPECEGIALEEIAAAEEDSDIQPQVIPSTANIFEIEEFRVHPVVKINNKTTYLEGHYWFRPASFAPTTVRAEMTAARQQELIDYAAGQGYEVIGWYLTGTIHMECYLPHRVEYRTFSHDNNGQTTKAVNIFKSTYRGTLSTYALFPSDMTKDYTYGFEGNGYMTVYYSAGNTVRDLYPTFVMNATFKQS